MIEVAELIIMLLCGVALGALGLLYWEIFGPGKPSEEELQREREELYAAFEREARVKLFAEYTDTLKPQLIEAVRKEEEQRRQAEAEAEAALEYGTDPKVYYLTPKELAIRYDISPRIYLDADIDPREVLRHVVESLVKAIERFHQSAPNYVPLSFTIKQIDDPTTENTTLVAQGYGYQAPDRGVYRIVQQLIRWEDPAHPRVLEVPRDKQEQREMMLYMPMSL